MAVPTSLQYKLRLFYAITGIFIGISVFCVFGFNFHNWNAALWGLSSGLVAAIALSVHLRYKRGTWEIYTDTLKSYMLLGCFIQLAGVCGFVTYLVLGLSFQQGLVIYGPGYFLTCVWCFMTWKWGFFLLFYSRSYRRIYCEVYTILPKEDFNSYN